MRKYHKLLKEYEELEEKYVKLRMDEEEKKYRYEILYREYEEKRENEEETRKLHDATRRLKHDMKNHMMVLMSYLNESEIDEAKQYITTVFEELNQVYTYIETGNVVMNYCINSKLQKAQEQKIEIKAEVENLSFHRVNSIHLSAILTNLLDNAIEGSANVKNPYIEVVIKRKRSYETILIKNRIDQSVLAENEYLHTTKVGPGHGYGILQVKDLVEKYDGIVDIYEENQMFCVMVAIYP